ncbi:MarR family winged helix-turn-helix transcriptional regulator [Streptomyces sp. NPDC056121]|uniref:MarR family winged helix-turn-helix transcriptional regulator n=1 Tax=Streptomyces TaxID=1883 RepID=UPI001D0B5E94|nr:MULTISPECIES: MarR family transcriptional regulator [Streptomyces]MCX5084054.1 winged helix DNA-binding protein [Streptomyces sp. NBC_00401]UDM04609.1 winged helix DNA-binding protein [Streptomyces longhuiensis]
MARSPGAELALLLLGGFQSMADDVHGELANRGHKGVRASHEFALRAIDEGADTATELGRSLSVSKQAAAKTIAALERLGYLEREADPNDARLKRLRVTDRGHDMMTLGAALFTEVRERWAAQIGAEQLDALEAHLTQLAKNRPPSTKNLARLREDLGEAI